MYTPSELWLLLAALGSVLLLVSSAGRLGRYLRDVLSANIYETGVVYDYPEDFNADDHTHFTSGDRSEKDQGKNKGWKVGKGALNRGPLGGVDGNGELNILRHFISNAVFPDFQNQRDAVHGGNHFAVLILLEKSLHSLSGDWSFRPLKSTGAPYIDSRYRMHPPRKMYGNYVVARPQLHKVNKILRTILFRKVPDIFYEHAEAMLVNEFDTLCEMFEASCRHETKVIILFSLLFPCDRCTGELVKKFGHRFRTRHPAVQRVILVFALFWHRIPFDENWRNFERLKQSGFDIVRVKV